MTDGADGDIPLRFRDVLTNDEVVVDAPWISAGRSEAVDELGVENSNIVRFTGTGRIEGGAA